jgi:hypothetical protein
MSGVFQNIDPPPPSLPGECVPRAFGGEGGRTHSLGGGGWSIFWKTPDTALCTLHKHFVVYSYLEHELGGDMVVNTVRSDYSIRDNFIYWSSYHAE